jgi:ABC-2 type transport system permease protein
MRENRAPAPNSLIQLTAVRFREFLREPEAVFWTFIFPVLMAAGLGIAFRNQPAAVLKVGVVTGHAATAGAAAAIRADKRLQPVLVEPEEAARALRTGRVVLAITADSPTALGYRFDDTNPDGRQARMIVDDVLQRAAGRRDPASTRDEPVRETGSRYIDFLVPGLLGMNLMGSGIWGIGFPIVDARRKKLLKRLIASPMSRGEYLLSFLLARLVFLLGEIVALVGFGAWVFGVPMRGPLAVFGLICLLGSLMFSALGLLIASRARTIEAASGLMNFVMLPMWVLSGVFFSADRFPDAAQPFIRVLPLTAINDALRANMLEGAGLAALAGKFAVIAAWLGVSFLVALRIFRWR